MNTHHFCFTKTQSQNLFILIGICLPNLAQTPVFFSKRTHGMIYLYSAKINRMTTIFRIALCSILNYTDFSSRNMLNQFVKVLPLLASTVRKMSWEKTLKNTKDTIATRFQQHVNFKPWGATMIRYVINLLLCWSIAKVSIYLQWSVHFCFTFVTEEHWAVKDEKYKYIIFTPNGQMSKCNAINTHLYSTVSY